MKRRSFLKAVGAAAVGVTPAWSVPHLADQQAPNPISSDAQKALEQAAPEKILLKDSRPKSLYKIPITEVRKEKFPIIDMHSHAYAKTPEKSPSGSEIWMKSESRRPFFLRTHRDKSLPIFNG